MYGIVAAHFGVVQGEAVVVFGSDGQVFHAGVLRQLRPGLGVEAGGVELPGEAAVLFPRDFQFLHRPFRALADGQLPAVPLACQLQVGPPVDE